jgi:hypothetical protein
VGIPVLPVNQVDGQDFFRAIEKEKKPRLFE